MQKLELRVFKRYSGEVRGVLTFDNETFSAKTVDYSFNSVGLLINEEVSLMKGDIIEMAFPGLGIQQRGKVVWATRHAGSVRAGIERLGMLTGTLKLYRLSDILIGLQRTLKTGVLEFRLGSVVKEVRVRNGNMVSAASNLDEDRIGDILLREGRLTPEQYAKAADRKSRKDERYVFILVDEGYFRPADLIGLLDLQATLIIQSLFEMNDASVEFREGPLPAGTAFDLRVSAADLIYHELKKSAVDDPACRYLPERIVDFSRTPLNLFQNIKLDDADRRLLSFVDGKTTVRDIIRLAAADEKKTLRDLCALIEARILEVKETDDAPEGIKPEDVGRSAVNVDDMSGLINRIDEMYSKFGGLTCYGLLGISGDATGDDVKKAYYKAAKEFHPDLHFSLPEDVKAKLMEIFSAITNAYLTLKDHGKRREYEEALRNRVSSGPPRHEEEAVSGGAENAQAGSSSGQGIASHSSEESQTSTAWTNHEEGKTKFRKGQFEDAAHLFATAIYFDGAHAEFHFFYGLTLDKLGKTKEALQSLNRAIELSPNIPEIHAEMGHIYIRLDCPLRAKGCFDRALKLDPGNKRALQGIAAFNEKTEKTT